ncbi:TRAP transporter large permease [Pusillimonas noertemannii]|uniref:TRAP transporter large permease protein n=1 Tax=Pusillimonas noertemannii TaxID=305977 RepID=A0A2U1CNF6_9BURK|nr:TRAP transporter large permease [Pusillimonas noertemannii]NYT68445.1 TRAP transporter large permease [Pusillimonas noertemannii]PVY62538.1 tripartite ATP-independent transporter DctM subunit [Pusillimonas noertemannii]TFL10510.1 TRAP transporter large permease [Pusillimonas noertemannii]
MTASLIGFAVMVLMMASGIPIAVCMGAVGVVGFGLLVGWAPALAMTGQIVVDNMLNYSFSLLPLFILMGNLIAQSRLSQDLYSAAYAFLGHYRGGLAHATILACGGFSAVSGSSMATAATMGKVALPQMRRYGYADGLAVASVAAGGTLGILIPPSVILIIYGFLTNTDIAQLFMAGVLPGLLGILLYSMAVTYVTLVNPKAGPRGERTAWPQRLRALVNVWAIVLLFVLILGGIYSGLFTPNEAAGIGAAGAFLFALGRRTLTWQRFLHIVVDTVRTTSMMFFLLFGALLFSNFLSIAGGATALEQWIGGLGVSPLTVMIIIVCIYLVLGTMLESLSMILLTVPLLLPVVSGLGIDLVWFGIVVVIATEVGLISPPVGLNIFVLKATFPDISTGQAFRGVLPFFVFDLVRIGLVLAFPAIVLFLPALMN